MTIRDEANYMFYLILIFLLAACFGLSLVWHGDRMDWLLTHWFYVAMGVCFIVMLVPVIVELWSMR